MRRGNSMNSGIPANGIDWCHRGVSSFASLEFRALCVRSIMACANSTSSVTKRKKRRRRWRRWRRAGQRKHFSEKLMLNVADVPPPYIRVLPEVNYDISSWKCNQFPVCWLGDDVLSPSLFKITPCSNQVPSFSLFCQFFYNKFKQINNNFEINQR